MAIRDIKICVAGLLLGWALPVLAGAAQLSTELSGLEEETVQSRIEKFYRNFNPRVMIEQIQKFEARTGFPSKRQSRIDFRNHQVKRQSKLRGKVNSWSNIEPSDRVEDLVETYIPKDEIDRNLDHLPVKGEVSGDYWSGDYWSMNWGLTSYRYSTGKKFKLYKNAIEAYLQPDEWIERFGKTNLTELAREVELWSPAEKYDLLVGDNKFTLTREQKSEGADFVQSDGKVEDWFGICDGWSPASIFVPAPKKIVKTKALGGVEITWLPDDIRALASLAWTNGDYSHNLVGRRCDTINPKTYKNGRISETECADSNPATFHLALTHMIGLNKTPFIMDATFDAEVWNQPVLAYEIKYFNPRYPKQKSSNFRDVLVPYDEHFKRKDRFQKPLTRGYRKQNKYFDGGVTAIVGVQATVVYLVEYQAEFHLQPHENITERVTYTYDLELHDKNGALIPMGGEWHENTHPDFFWVPKKDTVATAKWDLKMPELNIQAEPNDALTSVARQSSKEGYPLCSVVEALVKESSESTLYRCRREN